MHILLVDDHTLFREGMRFLLQGLAEIIMITESDSSESALEFLNGQPDPLDFILLDLNMGTTNGIESLEQVRSVAPEVPIIVLSAEQDAVVIRQCIDAGAMGFISKTSSHAELLAAIQLILAGGIYLPRDVTLGHSTDRQSLKPESDILAGLSNRQREVLRYLLQGKPNKTISNEMNISLNTIKTHLSAIFRELGARNRTEAVYFAARAGVPLDSSSDISP